MNCRLNITKERYHKNFDELLALFLHIVDFKHHTFEDFMTRAVAETEELSDIKIKIAIIRDHRTELFINYPFPQECFNEIIMNNRKLAPGVCNKNLLKSYIDAYDKAIAGNQNKDHSVISSLVNTAIELGKSVNSPNFGFEFWKSLLPSYGDTKKAVWAEHKAMLNLNRVLFSYILPTGLVDIIIDEDSRYGEMQINLLMNKKSMVLNYPSESTPEDRERMAKEFEEKYIKTKTTYRLRR